MYPCNFLNAYHWSGEIPYRIGHVDSEKKAKVLETVKDSEGDFSYSFSLPDTSKIRALLGIPVINIANFTPNVECDLVNNDGEVIFPAGNLAIEGIEDGEINLYFQGGNTTAASVLSFNLLDFDFIEDPIPRDESDITTSWTTTTGIVFPIIDSGLLSTRVKNSSFVTEDFYPFIYVKTLVNKILSRSGLKLTGEIIQDAIYDKLLFTSASKDASQTQINNRSVNAGKVSNQTVTAVGSPQLVTFTDVTTTPYYSGSKGLWDTGTSRYTSDVKMDVAIECSLQLTTSVLWTIELYLNGAAYYTRIIYPNGSPVAWLANAGGTSTTPYLVYGDQERFDQPIMVKMEAGDYLEIFLSINTGSQDLTGGFFKITPIIIYDVLHETIMPNMVASDFIYGIFSLFNPIIEFNNITKTIDVNFFENIKNREIIDFSSYIKKIRRIDYMEIPSGYGQRTILEYNSGDSEEIEKYNERNEVCYGCGEIQIDNVNIEPSFTIPFDFSASFIKSNELFGGPLLTYNFFEFEDIGANLTISSVSNSGGTARFTTSAAHSLLVNDWVNISDTASGNYVGYGKVSAVPTSLTFEIANLAFISTTTGSVNRAVVLPVFSDGLYLTLNMPNYPIEDVSSKTSVYIESTSVSDIGYTYFDKPYTGRAIDNIKKVLSFDQVGTRDFTGGITMKQTYFRLFESILNGMPKLLVDAYIPYAVYKSFRFKNAIRYNDSIFYVNRITGYQASHLPCEMEIIKLP